MAKGCGNIKAGGRTLGEGLINPLGEGIKAAKDKRRNVRRSGGKLGMRSIPIESIFEEQFYAFGPKLK